MTVQAVTKTAGWEAPVRERDWGSGERSDFTLYLAGLLHRPGLTQFAGRQELSGKGEGQRETAAREKVDTVRPDGAGRGAAATGPDDRAGQQVRGAGREAAGVDRTPPGVKSQEQGENQAAPVKQDEAPEGQQRVKEAGGEPGAAAGKAAATAARAGNSHQNNMPAGEGVPAEAANPLGQGKPHTLLPGQKTAGLDVVTGRLPATTVTVTRGKEVVTVVAGEGQAVLTTATIPGAAGNEVSLTSEGILLEKGAGLPGYGLSPGTTSSLRAAGSKGSFQQGVPEVQGQAKNGGMLFSQEAGHQARAPGNILNSANPGPDRNHTSGQRGSGTTGGPGITGNDSIVAGQGSFPALFPGIGQQAGGVVLPVSNLPEVMATIIASARMSRPGSQQELEIQLQPESLGNMKLRATLEGGRLALHLLVENSEAARALQAAVPEMRQAVAQQGLRLDQVQVQVAGGGHGSDYQTGSRGEHRQRPGWQHGAAWTAHEEETVTFGTWYRLDYLA
ncbi:Flagellar hook-length control protein-like,C-terminal [Moorella glycerini]|uniref:Flagellar hook-length control protein FliK n=1 Tax=Neomoorella stamsii TaxID=1266720 RepID=A0A9X7J2J8_9FIRM|nr:MULTISPECIES: flagellar hook-length control protein FliK [Moorella]PRR72288.1 Flagellar hook-length control protein FliK [Moorella stamsii]CEP68901.1 Flagellar hook-length control protein-like,C-terminal [Moorella glycerini]CEP69589.1 Flagellar hook-length control protein-like,C-terminal [Moorella glycerini]